MFNYTTWFAIIFLIASYIRFYPNPVFENRRLWGWLTLVTILLSVCSIIGLRFFLGPRSCLGHFFLSDSNKLFAVDVAICSFLWFKNLNIKYSKVINAIGASTFGVLLIHANSDAMRAWLWKDTVNVVGHYGLPLGELIIFSISIVLVVFMLCNLIDQIRVATIEKWFFNWYDRKLSIKVDVFINRIIDR